MKELIILATLLAMPALADEKPFMEFGDIKGDASVIDNAEESANEVKDETEVEKEALLAPAQDHNTTRSNRAQDYNSSRSNRRGIRLDEDSDDDGLEVKDVARACNGKDDDCNDQVRDAAEGQATGKRQHKSN